MTIAPLAMSPSAAAQAYRSVESGAAGGAAGGTAGGDGGSDFGSTLQRAIHGAVETANQADAKAVDAISGHGNISEVVTAVSKAELALQTTVALRDRVVQAYQDIMRMPI
jgi:flagellar hook-basal body complex protein FliE